MLNLDPGMMVWAWITFAVFMFVLYKTALGPLLASLTEREQGIRSDIEEAKSQREEAEQLLAQHKKMITEADAEAQKVLKEAQELAEKTKSDIVEKARKEALRTIEKANQEIEKQRDDAINALKAEVVDLAIDAAEKILVQTIDKNTNKKVVDDYIAAMPKSLKN